MKRSKTKLLEMTARQGRTARAELLETSEREQFLGGSLRYLCDLLGVQESNARIAVAQAADRIRAMQAAGAEAADLRAQLAKVRHDRNEAIGVIDDLAALAEREVAP